MAKHTLQYTKEQLDEILASVGNKFGYVAIERFDEAKTTWWMDCYASEADHDAGKAPLQSIEIPISTAKGDTYAAVLEIDSSKIGANANIVVSERKLVVPINYRSIKRTEITGNVNAGYSGTLVIQRGNGETWSDVGTYPTQLTSQNDSDVFVEVDLGRYLVDGYQQLQIQAIYEYKTDDGETKTVRSTFINIGASVTYTQLRLELETSYQLPMYAKNSETGAMEKFKVKYRAFGSCDKVVKYRVYGSVGTYESQQTQLANQNGGTIDIDIDDTSAYGLLTHGVRKVEAWVEASDGLGGTIVTEVSTNHFMMVADTADTKKYLLLQNLKSVVTNYIQTTLCDYAIYSPDGTDTDIEFQLTDASGNIYTQMNRTAKALEPNSLVATIEIDSEEGSNIKTYITRFYAFNGETNMILDSGYKDDKGKNRSYFNLTVDNENAITPIAGASFKLDVKNRNNEDEDYLNIYGPDGSNIAEWINPDRINGMWTTDDSGIKVLRIMAGTKLILKRNIWKAFMTNAKANMTFCLDYKVSNVTNTTDPIVSISGGTGGRGLVLNALQGWIKTAKYNNPDDCMFAWREDKRQYLSLSVDSAVKPRNAAIKDVRYPSEMEEQSNKTIPLARILLNGDPVREIPFDTESTSEWCDDPNAAIIIGNDGADIDIYSMLIYDGQNRDPHSLTELLNKNYLSSIPTTEEKQKQKERNAIFDGTRITLLAAQQRGFNCIVYHGTRTYKHNSSDQKTGWIEYFRYDQNGVFMEEHSGTNCKHSNALGWKPQGTTAQEYYEFNQQDDNSKVAYNFAKDEGVVHLKRDEIHESIVVGEPKQGEIDEDEEKGGYYKGTVVEVYGGNLGKNFPFEKSSKPYPYVDGKVVLPDGWIDGNGKYRGMGYQVSPDTPLAQKKVAKINFASSMQSHLIGACTTYDLLHYAVVGATPLQQQYERAGLTRPVMAKHTEPFLMFWDDGDGTPYYSGLCVYGAGKMDKVSWGYVKSLHPYFAMFEGAQNDTALGDFLIPFDKNCPYSIKDEGFKYGVKGDKGITYSQAYDFDEGKTEKFTEPHYDDGWPIIDKPDDETKYEAPSKDIRDRWADIHNFIYLNGTNIKYFKGTESEFKQKSATLDRKSKYWCTTPFHDEDTDVPLRLFRYDYMTDEWIDAGLLGADGNYTMINMKTDVRTSAVWEADNKEDAYDDINEAFIQCYAKFMKEHIEYFVSAQSLRFCYGYVLSLLSGTDNSSKNTYYQIDPIAQTMTRNEAFASWFSTSFGHDFKFDEVYRVYMSGDDMDSILPLNNKGNLTKPYYLERLYPKRDDTDEVLYEGLHNQLFNFVEKAYTDEERANMMNTILTRASQLVSESDNLLALKDKKISTWGFLHKYFFNIQYYFPQVAYIEQARIRYEFPELLGDTGARGVRPISQSIGSNVENEQQFMLQRVVYFASFASFGEFNAGTNQGTTGITDTDTKLSFQGAKMPDGTAPDYVFTITPHQYMYPCGFYTNNTQNPRQRTAPGQTCSVTLATKWDGASDDNMGLLGVNYYSDLGDLGKISTTSAITISGKRLTRFHSTSGGGAYMFRPSSLTINATNISQFYYIGYTTNNTFNIDLSLLIRCQEVIVYYGIREIIYPKTNSLMRIYLYDYINRVNIEHAPNLSILFMGDYVYRGMKAFRIGANVGQIDTKTLVNGIYNRQQNLATLYLESIHIENINWEDFDIETLMWYTNIPTCEFKGKIAIKEDDPNFPAVKWDYKNKINAKFGLVDSSGYSGYRGLLLQYQKRTFNPNTAKLLGNFYVEAGNNFQFELRPQFIYENTQLNTWWLYSGVSNVKVDSKGVLIYTSLADTQSFGTVTASIQYVDGNVIKQSQISKTIEIWNRPAQVGDLVYYDGTFSSKESYDGEKTVIGRCIYVAPTDAELAKYPHLFNKDDTWKRIMVNPYDIMVNGSTSLQFGVYPINGDTTNQDQNSLFYLDNSDVRKDLTVDGVGVADILNIGNISTGGLTLADGTATSYISDASIRDTNTEEGKVNGGFKYIAPNYAMGDGFGSEVGAMPANSSDTGRKLNTSLAALAGSGYKNEDVVNSSYAKTLKIIQHRNSIIAEAQSEGYNGLNGLSQLGRYINIPSARDGRTELEDLGYWITKVREWAAGQDFTDEYPNKWSQLLYPAASACYAYEPTNLKEGEVLADKFKAHNWALPANGLLARMFWYTYDGQGKDAAAPVKPEGVLDTVLDPSGKVIFKRIPSSDLWSVTESNSGNSWLVNFGYGNTGYGGKSISRVGRAVSAF